MAASRSMTSRSTSRWRRVLRSRDSSALSLGATFSLSRYAAVDAAALAWRTCSSCSAILSASVMRCFRRSATSAARLSTSTTIVRGALSLRSTSISDWRPRIASIVSAVSAARDEILACTAAIEDFTDDTIAFVSWMSAISFLTSCTRPAMATASSLAVSPSASRFSTRLSTSVSSGLSCEILDSCASKFAIEAADDARCSDSSSTTRLSRVSLSTTRACDIVSAWTNESLSSWRRSLTASSSPLKPNDDPPGVRGDRPPGVRPPGLLGDTGTPAGDANSVSTFIG